MVHGYNLAYIKMWIKTHMDVIFMMDDWAAENNLLDTPRSLEKIFETTL